MKTVIIDEENETVTIGFINSHGEIEYDTYAKADGGTIETDSDEVFEKVNAELLIEFTDSSEDSIVYEAKEVEEETVEVEVELNTEDDSQTTISLNLDVNQVLWQTGDSILLENSNIDIGIQELNLYCNPKLTLQELKENADELAEEWICDNKDCILSELQLDEKIDNTGMDSYSFSLNGYEFK